MTLKSKTADFDDFLEQNSEKPESKRDNRKKKIPEEIVTFSPLCSAFEMFPEQR
jgi:hypothetical protein